MKKTLFPIFILIIFDGCLGDKISETMKSWVGHTEADLVQSWGPPTSVYKMDDGSKILTYRYSRDNTGTAYTDNYGYTHYSDNSYTATRNFTVNSSGIIVSWRWQGY